MRLALALCLCLVTLDAFAGEAFPTGQATPEGAACDLARAFIKRDAALFSRVCLPPFGEGQAAKEYRTFLAQTKGSIVAEAARKTPSPGGPTKIVQCFAARHLTKNGPASYGYAMFDFHDVMFVDVKVELANKKTYLNRTLVVKDDKGKWYVHPAPGISPLLSAGLNEESASTKVYKPGSVAKTKKPPVAKRRGG
jgi:hypothetical protein